ncbi:MAG: DUF1940 domain-containing protein [Candidatus Thermoplasmatota archaeon]|nr:DUF1940 domain-containing protein [Candidatus Thermoplasmatota archaeon]MCL5731376.1 DUF1940 domain-containing protein [Candidatus Thermoplasmatota archaeon]
MEDGENNGMLMCDLIGTEIPADHPFFRFQSRIRLSMSNLALAISCGVRLEETRELLDALDTLYNNLYDQEEKLSDQFRKRLNHEEEVWIDLKQKFFQGDQRSAYLLSAHSFLKMALSDLYVLKKDDVFADRISDYVLKYMYKLSVSIYREAMGHVML